MIIVFSKDRAFQLEACLRSLLAQCADASQVPIRVLWTASTDKHERAYAILRESYAAWPNLLFVRESKFRVDFLALLGGLAPSSFGAWILRTVEKLPASWLKKIARPLTASLLRAPSAVLYVVDDSIFLRPFHFRECAKLLLAKPEALAFSLRLGRGLTRFYMGDRDQVVPELALVGTHPDVVQFRWAEADGDFSYPLEVSSSLLKSEVILSRLLRKEWRTPNTLEMALANMSGRYKREYPMLLTFGEPRAVSVPLNMVQKDFTDNRHGGQERYHPDSLCALFLEGLRADLSGLDRIKPTSVHAEIELLPGG
jgi:hypothetical protein